MPLKNLFLSTMMLLMPLTTQADFTSTIPSGAHNVALTAECTSQQLEREALAAKGDVKKYEFIINQFFQRCEKQLTNGRLLGSYLGMINFGIVDYWFNQSSLMKPVLVTNKSGDRTPGYLALKPGNLPRPLVIVKCGVFCSGDALSSTMNYMINLFDQGPFHVLLLANRTGVSYVRENRNITMGGVLEGKDLVEIGEWVKNESPYKDKISSLHLLGYSLGGHAASYATLYNDLELSHGNKIFSSIIPVCAAMDLEPTIRKLYQPGTLAGKAALSDTKAVFGAIRGYVPEVEDLIAEENLPTDITKYPDLLVQILMRYQMPRRGLASTPEGQFWHDNNFFSAAKKIQTPTFYWASKNDPVVNYKINTGRMIASTPLHSESNVAAVGLSYGSHCTFNSAYGIPTVSSVFRSFILNHSPEMAAHKKHHQLSLQWKSLPLRPGVVISDYRLLRTEAGVQAEFIIFDEDRDPSCNNKTYLEGHQLCFTSVKRQLDPSILKEFDLFEAKNDVDLQTQTRMLNSMIEFKAKGKDLRGQRATPDSLEWSDYR